MEARGEPKFEIGHALFVDIVGYSKLNIHQQSELLETLKQIVRGAEQFKKAEAEGKLLRLPTGDGGALVFRTTPEAPVLCALEISNALKTHPELKVRMGIHSGPVNEITDLNEQANIAGAGINLAQRVMDCGDAGHILVSKHVADDLQHYPRWEPFLHPLREFEVKHGARIGIVNLYNGDTGNATAPARLQSAQQPRSRTRWAAIATALLLLCGIGAAFVFVSKRSATSTANVPEKSIAVLPFENLSSDKENAYFADGVQDEILTKLASIADLKVISRTSTAKYKSKPEDLKTVAQQLGVATVLEGTVQRAADKVRVNVQLIDARADSHLWAKTYDRDIKDVFAVESEVSQEIGDALQAKLSPNESHTLATAPTKDPEAYDLYLKGEYAAREAQRSFKDEAFNQAADWYRQALDRDPGFVLASAGLVKTLVLRHHFGTALTATEVEEVGRMAEQAVKTAPDLAQAHIALGFFWYSAKFQYDKALVEFQRALALQPNNLEALSYVAGIHQRQGMWESSLAELKKCEELDPRSALTADRIAGTYLDMRMWEDAKRSGLHSLALDPHNVAGMHIVFYSYIYGTGDISEAKRLVETFPPDTQTTAYVPDSFVTLVGLRSYVSILKRDFGAALKEWDGASSDPAVNEERILARTVIHLLAGDATDPTEIDKAREVVESKVRDQPEDVDSMIELAWINLALNRKDEALKLGQQAIEKVPIEKDAAAGSFVLVSVAEIQAHVGQTGEAINALRRLLSIPAGLHISLQRLKIDAVWDPIRNDPGFQQLLAGTELTGPPNK
jgi:TolB-like protein/cytochrome c-type biogenesis protein CcmH/NrfG